MGSTTQHPSTSSCAFHGVLFALVFANARGARPSRLSAYSCLLAAIYIALKAAKTAVNPVSGTRIRSQLT